MPGTVSGLLHEIIEQKSRGNEVIKNTIRTKLILMGFHPDVLPSSVDDDPEMIERVMRIADRFGVNLLSGSSNKRK